MGSVDKLILLKIVTDNNGEYRIEELPGGIKNIPEFRTLVCFGANRIAALSDSHFYECNQWLIQSRWSKTVSGSWWSKR